MTERITVADVRPHLERKGDYQWEIYYQGAECRFESPDDELGIIHHLWVPKPLRGRGIGTAMATLAVSTLTGVGVDEIHSQVREDGGATEHVLSKMGFDTMAYEKSDPKRTGH